MAAKYAADWPAWGHRKIAAVMRADGHQASTSTVERALRRRGLLLPRGFRADRKSWAALRRKVFHDPPTERNRVWQRFTCETARAASVAPWDMVDDLAATRSWWQRGRPRSGVRERSVIAV
ncbi:MAG: hypothetical protein ABJB47_02935, partial [Actinomycetota bacterium]